MENAVNAAACTVPTRTLSTDCGRRCGLGSPSVSCVSLDTTTSRTDVACALPRALGECQVADYACRAVCFAASQENATEFKFFIPFGAYESDRERQQRRASNATDAWQAQVDALPSSSTRVPYLGNDYLVSIGPLSLSAKISAINVAGGYSSDVGIKGKVSNVTFTQDTFANVTNVTSLSLAHLNVSESTPGFVAFLPPRLSQLRLVNCLLETVPTELSRLESLQSLNLTMNYIAALKPTLSLPALATLDLSKNNLTVFEVTSTSLRNLQYLDLRENAFDEIPTGVFALPSLKTLRATENPLHLAVLTPHQYTFLSRLETLEIDSFQEPVDCSRGELKTLGTGAVRVCVTSETTIPVPSSADTSGNKTVLILSIVGGILVALMVASFAWRKLWGQQSSKYVKASDVAKHESEGSDSSGGEFEAYASKNTPTPVIAKPTPDHSTTTSVTHSLASADGLTSYLHSHSSDELLLSHHSASSGTRSSHSLNSGHSRRSPLTQTVVISRQRSILSGMSLWDDGELHAYLLKYEDIEDVRLIGSGGHGVVWLVNYRQTRQLASKRLIRDQITRQKTFDFVAEIKLVAQLHHPSIVEFVGVAWTVETDLQALFEYMPDGDLRTYLQHTSPDGSAGRRRTIGSAKDDSDEPPVLSWVHDKWQLALSISEALVYVHSFLPPLVHRDLKSRNVLLSADMNAKLSDFGVSRFESENGTMSTNVGTSKWLAPEVVAGSKTYDASCDIYAFGVLLSELDTHELPYDDVVGEHGERLPEIAILQRIAANELTPTLSPSCPPDIVDLATRCLSFEPTNRPTAVNVAFDLRTFARKHGFYDVEQL